MKLSFSSAVNLKTLFYIQVCHFSTMEGSKDTVELASNKKIKISNTPKDNIGRLPEDIFHNILSFLDMKEALQTSFLSKRWRYTWKSVPVMNFDYSLWEPEEESSSKKKKKRKRIVRRLYVKRVLSKEGCMNFVDRVIYVFRDRSTKILKLKLSEHYCRDEGRLDTLLFHVIPNLEEFHLESSSDLCLYTLPPSLFTSTKLKVFVLSHKIGKVTYAVFLPDTLCSNCHLTTLSLQCCRLPHDRNGELVLNNPVLKKLALINCDHLQLKAIKIIAPQLKELVVENCLPGDRYDCSERVWSCELKLCASSLSMLRLDGHPYGDFSLGVLSSLVTADIKFIHWPSSKNFLRSLHLLRNVFTLKLDLPLLESRNVLHELLSLFHNLRHVNLGRILSTESCIPSVNKFLQSCPSVETLVLQDIHMLTISDEKYWTMELPMQEKFHHLRCFGIEGCQSHDNEFKLLTFILKNSTALEKIEITYDSEKFEGGIEEMFEFKHRVYSLLEASSKVTINLYEEIAVRIE